MAAASFGALREQWNGLVARVRDAYEQRPPRERLLIAAAAGTFAVFLLVITTLLIMSKLDELSEHNRDVREALKLIHRDGDVYRARKRAEQALDLKLSRPLPGLLKFVDDIASQAQIKIAESSEKPAQPRGTKYQSRSVELKFREIDLPALVSFLKKVESSPHPIVVERLMVKPRYGQHDKLDVEITVTGFEKGERRDKKKGKGGRTRAGRGS